MQSLPTEANIKKDMNIGALVECKKFAPDCFPLLLLQASEDLWPIDFDEIWRYVEMQQRGLAHLLIRLLRNRWVFDPIEGRWYHYTPDNYVWIADADGTINWEREKLSDRLRSLENHYQSLVTQYESAGQKDQAQLFKERTKIIGKLRFKVDDRINYWLDIVKTASYGYSGLALQHEWNDDLWMLPCANGLLDLQTGQIRDGDQNDYIRVQIPTWWNGINEPCHLWMKFLDEVFDGDTELICYVQQAVGATLTGHLKRFVGILTGAGFNGKSVFIETIYGVLGPLAGMLNVELFLEQKMPSSPHAATPEISYLRHKRFVWASESGDRRKLSASRIKLLSGDDTLKSRGLYEKEVIQFEPSHTLFLSTNFKPVIDADDPAIWDRIRIIHFPLSFVPEPRSEMERRRDPAMKEKLKNEASGILAWMVRGALEWQKAGRQLPSCNAVELQTTEYRAHEDTIGLFLEECTDSFPGYSVKAQEIYDAFRAWCENNGFKRIMNNTQFGEKMQKKVRRQHCVDGNRYLDICLKTVS